MARAVELVVCAYGESPYLDSCLASLAPQIDPVVRLSVATSTPTKNIEAAARRWGARYLVNPHRLGIAGDWNFALGAATAPLVTLCHQDDVYSHEYASIMASVFEAAPDVLFATCDHAELSHDGERPLSMLLRIKRMLMRRAFRGALIRRGPAIRRALLSWGNPVSCPGVMLNRELLPDFRFDECLSSNLDWDAWDRLMQRQGSVAYVDRPLVAHRVHSASATTALIANSTRPAEDQAMLARYWPRPVAALIFQIYRLAYRNNADLPRTSGRE